MNNHKPKTAAFLGGQWGDEGKGKIVDAVVAQWIRMMLEVLDRIPVGQIISERCTGGPNAGHTVWDILKFAFRLTPSAILHDKDGVVCIIGRGVAYDLLVQTGELAMLDERGRSYNNLLISQKAKLILPQHLLLDRLKESKAGKNKIGTTGRGVGPCLEDHVGRIGLVVNDLFNKDVFDENLDRNMQDKWRKITDADPELVKQIMHHPDLGNGQFYSPAKGIDIDAVQSCFIERAEKIRDMVRNTDEYVQCHVGKSFIALEPAQGALLSIDDGTYKYVTSTDTTILGLAKGAGLHETQIDEVYNVIKGFYMTRVGEGPFPTEMGGKRSEDWCNTTKGLNREMEIATYPDASLNSEDDLLKGSAIRVKANEFGTVTGRSRRVGWLDLVQLRYVAQLNGGNLAMSCLDIFDGCDEIKIATEYRYEGPDYFYAGSTMHKGKRLTVGVPDPRILRHCTPVYDTLPGWKGPVGGIRSFADLPPELQAAVAYVERAVGTKTGILSVGKDREQTIFVD